MFKLIERYKREGEKEKIAFELYHGESFCLPSTINGSQFCGAEQRQARSGLHEESEKSHHLE